MAQKRVIKPSDLRRKRKRRRNLKIIFWTIIFLVIIFGLGFLTHLQAMTVNNIKVKGNDILSSEDLIKMARDDMAGNYFFIFSKSNILLYPKKYIENEILREYTQVRAVSIKQLDLESIQIVLTERKPIALWCRGADCYFIDSTGYIFARSPTFSGNVFFTYSGLISAEDPIGAYFLPEAQFSGLNSFLDNVKKLGIPFDSLSASDTDDFDLTLQNGSHILFTANQPFDQTINNLQTVMDRNNPSGNSIDLSNTEYVDLRFGNKVIYKLKGSIATTTATTTASGH